MHEQQFALKDDSHEAAMYQQPCHLAMKHDKPVEGNAKGKAQAMNAPFGEKSDFHFKVSLVEENIPSESTVWNH